MNKEIVYVVSGHHNSNYEGIFAHVFDTADKFNNMVNKYIADNKEVTIAIMQIQEILKM